MRRTALLMTLVTALGMLVLASPGSASAADNKNAQTLHFTCEGGITFTGATIAQNNAIVVQIVEDGDRTFVFTNITADDGTVFFNVPGFDNKETLACRIEEFPGGVFTGFFAPRSG